MANLAAILQHISFSMWLNVLCLLAAGYLYVSIIRPLLQWKNHNSIDQKWTAQFISRLYDSTIETQQNHTNIVEQNKNLQETLEQQQQQIQQLTTQQQQQQQNIESVQNKLHKTIDDYENRLKNELESIIDIVYVPSNLLEEFLKDVPAKLQFFTEKLRLFQENTAGYGMIYDLHAEIRDIKNNLRLLKFKPLVAQVQKIEVLLDIVSHRNEGFKIEQISEIENMMREFMGSLQRYIQITEKFITTQNKKTSKIRNSQLTNSQISIINSYLDNIHRAAFSLTIPPGTTAEYLQKIQSSLNLLHSESHIFEFSELFKRILHFLKIKFLSRRVKLSTSHDTRKILLYGDSIKICKLLTLVISMSFLRGEIGSSLKISSRVIKNSRSNSPDTLEITTYVGIRNTDDKTLSRIENLCQEYQLLCNECAAELLSTKRGFQFQLPMVVNKKLPEVLEVGILGRTPGNLNEKIKEIEATLPLEISINYINPEEVDFANLDIAIITSQSLESFYDEIQEMRQSIYAIPVILIADLQTQEKEHLIDGVNYLRLPIRKHELKWSFLRCLKEIIPTTSEVLQTTSVFYKIPKSK